MSGRRRIGAYRQDTVGNARIGLLTYVWTIIVLAGLILMVSEIQAEVIGGVIGGLVVLLVPALTLWLRQQYGRFELRFLRSDEAVTAEHMRIATALGVPVGGSVVRFSLRPRTGIVLRRINFAFFDNPIYPKRLFPQAHGRRRAIQEIQITRLEALQEDGSWFAHKISSSSDEAIVADLDWPLYEQSRRVFEIEIKVSNSMKGWDGILGVQLRYLHGGDLALRNVYTKAFIREPSAQRPPTFILRRVQRSRALPSADKEGSGP